MIARKPVPLFFAFPDGVFHYVCRECDALCCRGQGFAGSLAREMAFLLDRYPPLGTMASARQLDLVDISTPSGCCFFLRPDNLCRIETEHGREKKPGACLIFPFNRFHRVGRTVVITPHFLCPLRVEVPARPGEVAGTHLHIEADIRESAFIDHKYVEWFVKSVRLLRGSGEDAVLSREARFRDACGAALGRACLKDILTLESRRAGSMQRMVDRISELMAWGPAPTDERSGIDDIMLAIAPVIRIELLHLPENQIALTLALADRLVRRVFSLSAVPPRPQAVYSIIQQNIAVLRLLGYGNRPIRLRNKPNAPHFLEPDLVIAALLARRDIESSGVVRALEKSLKRLPSPSDRAVLVHHIAEQLAGKT